MKDTEFERTMSCICHMPEMADYPTAKAFTFYVMSDMYGFEDTHDGTFLPVNMPYSKDYQIKYVMALSSQEGEGDYRTEFMIAFDKVGAPAIMLRRDYDNGVVNPDILRVISYEMTQFDFDVQAAVLAIPSIDYSKFEHMFKEH